MFIYNLNISNNMNNITIDCLKVLNNYIFLIKFLVKLNYLNKETLIDNLSKDCQKNYYLRFIKRNLY